MKLTFILEFRSERIKPRAEASGTVRNDRRKLLAWHGVSTRRYIQKTVLSLNLNQNYK